MTNLTVKNIPTPLYERLKQRAADNRRSLNNEIIVVLEQGLGLRQPEEVTRILERTRKIRELTADYVLRDDEIEKAINEGRA